MWWQLFMLMYCLCIRKNRSKSVSLLWTYNSYLINEVPCTAISNTGHLDMKLVYTVYYNCIN